MIDVVTKTRNRVIHFCYVNFFKKIFFLIDPERVHDRAIKLGKLFSKTVFTRKLTSFLFSYKNPYLYQTVAGILFKNPIGLAAGFDKNAELTSILPSLGFGFAEVGSITGEECSGNEKPRLWRLPQSKSLIVYYGLKNDGCVAISNRLKNKKFRIPIGMSVAKTNCKKTASFDEGIKDYVKAYKNLLDLGMYMTINISCPNAYGGQPFTDPKQLNKLLKKIREIKTRKPIFLKLSPDVTKKQMDEIILVAQKHDITGFILTNLTKNRKNKKIVEKNLPKKGGLSGKVVSDLATDLLSYVYKKTNGSFILIGCGGVFSSEDAYKKIKAGASLIQLITSMIYEGPQVISEINRGLVELLKKDGFSSIKEAVGIDHKK